MSVATLLSLAAHAALISGKVYTRHIIEDEAGNVVWVEYNPETGAVEKPVGSGYPSDAWRVMSGSEYRDYQKHYDQLVDSVEDLEPPISRQAFEENELLLADGTAISKKPTLGTATAFVVLLPQNRRLQNDPSSLVLGEYPFNPAQSHGVNEKTLSMLVNVDEKDPEMGSVAVVTDNRIGPQLAFYTDENGEPVPIQGEDADSRYRDAGQGVAGPIPGVYVEAFPYGGAGTNQEGTYVIATMNDLFCPYPTEWHYGVSARFQYQRFNPKDEGPPGVYYQLHKTSGWCIPLYVFTPVMGPLLAGVGPGAMIPNVDFLVDVTAVSGRAIFSNVAAGAVQGDRVQLQAGAGMVTLDEDGTRFGATAPDNSTIDGGAATYDFDNDGTQDTVKLGYFKTEEGERLFVISSVPGPDAPLTQGVWLSSGGRVPGQDLPDITRVLDSKSLLNLSHEGLLKKISAKDVRNTDVYVVRVSDGRLIAERIGLHEEEVRANLTGENADENSFYFSTLIRGAFGNSADFANRKLKDLQSKAGVNPALHEREADHLKPGDRVRIYAINRATGYMGSTEAEVTPASEGGGLGFKIDPILMGPPNLRIWATRKYDIKHGLKAGEVREDQIIGFEGASLNSDTFVAIYTEWLDHEGRPMPAALKGAGYTGRLARASGTKLTEINLFDINPGRNLQVLQLSQKTLDNQHFYIHVSGEPQSGTPIFADVDNKRVGGPDFTSSGQNPGILNSRPDNYVPFLVPVFDEAQTETVRQLTRRLKDQGAIEDDIDAEPVYRWLYRPEMQFTNYDLEMKKVEVGPDLDDNSVIDEGKVVDLLKQDNYSIMPTDVLQIFYSLGAPQAEALDYFNAGDNKKLVFKLGEQEIEATFGENGEIQFADNDALAHLSPDDHLTLSLYANNDLGNALWEYAFVTPGLYAYYFVPGSTPTDGKEIKYDQDDTGEKRLVRTLGGMRLRFRYVLPGGRELVNANWEFAGQAGWLCDTFLEKYATCDTGPSGKQDINGWPEIYWEPSKDSDHPLWSASMEVPLTVTITHKPKGSTDTNEHKEEEPVTVYLTTRELGPRENDPMQGSDVEMLEAVLWQLGLSPQIGSPGSEGARINSQRGKKTGWTLNCAEQKAERRDVFHAGWAKCKSGRVSLEAMLRRFQARNAASSKTDNKVTATLLGDASGKADDTTLGFIARDWNLYLLAYGSFESKPVIRPETDEALMDAWVAEATLIWDKGTGDTVPSQTYPESTHKDILTLAGISAAANNNREAFLRHWITKEASHHWGGNRANYQPTPYRLEEGGADEHGSLSFSQLLYGHRFGQTPCAAHADTALNLYDPRDQVKTFVVHTASSGKAGTGQTSCKGLMYRGFNSADRSLAKTFASDSGKIGSRPGNVADLRGYRHGNGAFKPLPAKEDDYAVLAKAIAGYNGGEGFIEDHSWAKFLKYKKYDPESTRNRDGVCHSCRYSIEVREDIFGQNLRTYLWFGGVYPDTDEEGIPHPQAGQAWCFEYGEGDWINAEFEISNPGSDAGKRAARFEDYRDRASVFDEHKTSCKEQGEAL